MARTETLARGTAAERLLRNARYEVLPTATIEEKVLAAVPKDVGLAERFVGHGYEVVPHLSARLVRDGAHLADLVARCVAAGITAVFVPAGDADPPAGEYDAALRCGTSVRTRPRSSATCASTRRGSPAGRARRAAPLHLQPGRADAGMAAAVARRGLRACCSAALRRGR